MSLIEAFAEPQTADLAANVLPASPSWARPSALVEMVSVLSAAEPIRVDQTLLDAFHAASSPHSLRALRNDLAAFDAWCRRRGIAALPATPEQVADYLDARAGE